MDKQTKKSRVSTCLFFFCFRVIESKNTLSKYDITKYVPHSLIQGQNQQKPFVCCLRIYNKCADRPAHQRSLIEKAQDSQPFSFCWIYIDTIKISMDLGTL